MSAIRTALTELRRLTATRLGRMSLIALVLIPTIYSGLYLYANRDPYDGLDRVPAALVVADQPATLDGKRVQMGREVADALLESKDFDWHEVDADRAEEGVRSGTYDFALTVPAGFTEALTSSARFEPERAQLQLTTNDANSFLSTTIATTVAGKVRDTIAERVGTEAADILLGSIETIHTNLVDAADGGDELAGGARTASDGAVRARDGASALAGGATTLHDGAAALATGAHTLSDGADDLAEGTGTLRTGTAELARGAGTLASGSQELSDGLGTLRKRTATLPSSTRQLADGARQVADGNAELDDVGTKVDAAATRIDAAYASARADLVATLTAQGLTAAQQKAVLDAYDRLGDPLRQARTRISAATGQLHALSAGADAVADGAETLADSTPALVQGIRQADTGASRLASGADQLDTGATRLASGARTLDSGASQLATGAARLDTGAAQLATGSGDLADGATELSTGVTTLADGLGDLSDGAETLASGLRDGAEKIPVIDEETRSRMAKTLGNPVAVKDRSQARAETYGAGLAPFFLALATWIGGYVLFLLVRPLSRRASAANQPPLRVALGGWLTPALLGVAQVSVMVLVVASVVGIGLSHLLATWAFLLLVTASFIAIVHLLNAALGQAGQFLGLVLMVLQLVTSGGTFPWQTIPTPLHALHHALPMTYAVEGLRQVMYGGDGARVLLCAGVLALWGVAALALTTVVARRQRTWTVRRLLTPEV